MVVAYTNTKKVAIGCLTIHDLSGEGIQPGRYTEWMNHYTLLRTIEKAYDLPPLGRVQEARPLSEIWKK